MTFFFFLHRHQSLFLEVKIWQATPVPVLNYIPVWIHRTQLFSSLVSVAGFIWPKPAISPIENTPLKAEGVEEMLQITSEWGITWSWCGYPFFVAPHEDQQCLRWAKPRRWAIRGRKEEIWVGSVCKYFTSKLLCEGENVHAWYFNMYNSLMKHALSTL